MQLLVHVAGQHRYGYQVEVKPTGVANGYTAVKHLAMGRAPWEMVRLPLRGARLWHASLLHVSASR
jgi:hypothetical protein